MVSLASGQATGRCLFPLLSWTRRVGFQSGNTVQTFIAISRAIYDPRNQLTSFNINDWQALTSILSFALACQFGGRILRIGQKKSRARIVTSAMLQMLLTVAAAVTAREFSDHPQPPTARAHTHAPFYQTTPMERLSISLARILHGITLSATPRWPS